MMTVMVITVIFLLSVTTIIIIHRMQRTHVVREDGHDRCFHCLYIVSIGAVQEDGTDVKSMMGMMRTTEKGIWTLVRNAEML